MWAQRGSMHVFSEDFRRIANGLRSFRKASAAGSPHMAGKFAENLKIEKQDLLPEVRVAEILRPGRHGSPGRQRREHAPEHQQPLLARQQGIQALIDLFQLPSGMFEP